MIARRELLKAGLGIQTLLSLSRKTQADTDERPIVTVLKGESPYDITKAALEVLGGMQKFVSRQSVVMVKPNIAFAQPPKVAATTNPEVVRAIIEMAFEAGAKKVLVMDNSVSDPAGAYKTSGIQAAAEGAGAEMIIPNPRRLVPSGSKDGSNKGFPVFRECLEVDTFINVPILKSHSMTTLTLGMKNLLGITEHREAFHGNDRGNRISELARCFTPHLSVVDAWRVIGSGGPISGPTTDLKTVIASEHMMEADVVAATLAGRRPTSIPYLESAARKKMGEIDMKRIQVKVFELK
jgi:uncharacterized protein (DUF362 family)